MAKIQKRKYEKTDDAEIGLVLQCNDSHEFYEKYREMFPNRKKGIDSISKIWKRRSEFLKKQQAETESSEFPAGSTHEFENLVSAQNKILTELSTVMREQLKVSREILTRLPKQIQRPEEHTQKQGETRQPEQKDPAKKPGTERPSDIMIGS